MSTLHLVFTVPANGTALADCLRAAADGDTVLLLQDAVYAAVAPAAAPAGLLREAAANGLALAALGPDVTARGISTLLHQGVAVLDDDAFVALTEQHPRILSWF